MVHHEPDPNGPGRYVNNEGNLAGSAITLIDCVRIAVEQAGIPLTNALRMASLIPAEIIGMGDQLGRIHPATQLIWYGWISPCTQKAFGHRVRK